MANRNHRAPILGCIIASLAALFGCSNGLETPGSPKWKLFDTAQQTSPAKGHAHLVVYRTEEDKTDTQAINVYINGAYHASLRQKGQTIADICPGQNSINVAINDANRGYLIKHSSAQALNLSPDQQVFVRVQRSPVDSTAGATILVVPASQAQQEMRSLATQSHTLSRLQTAHCPS